MTPPSERLPLPPDYFRAHARRRTDLQAVLRDHSGALAHGARITDLGLGGACVELSDGIGELLGAGAFDLDTSVTLEVTAPSLWDPLSLRGKVAWIRSPAAGAPTRAGVRFEHRDASALYALFQLLGAHGYEA